MTLRAILAVVAAAAVAVGFLLPVPTADSPAAPSQIAQLEVQR
jgi:hypothetical protein